MTEPRLAAARSALGAGDFDHAGALLAEMEASDEVLALRADAAYGGGHFESALHERETLFARQLQQDRRDDAALTASTIAMHLLVDTGLMAAVRGWVGRAERLLGGEPTPATAVLAAVRTYERLLSGDAEGAAHHAERAVLLGESLGVGLATVSGRIALARLLALDGHVVEGMAALDEVAVELMTGDHDAFLVGNMYCELVCAAQSLLLVDRAREWTGAMEKWRHGAAVGGIHGRCRVHRAELLRISGPASAAEDEALGACSDLRPWMRREYGWPLVELGNIRLRRGDLAGAEDAFLQAHAHAWSPLPGLALLRLEQGRLAEATGLVAAGIDSPFVLPWKERPPIAGLQLAPLLEAQAEIAAATGDAELAARAADRLAEIADCHSTPGVRAGADLAVARAALLRGETSRALTGAGSAVATWVELGAPYDAAVARTVLGHAHARAGSQDMARLEWQTARDALAGYGAIRRVAEVETLLGAAQPAAQQQAERARLRLDGSRWHLEFRDREAVLSDLKGMRMLGRLLAAPGRVFSAVDLAGVGVVHAGIPALDDEARAAYRQRLRDVEDDIAEAQRDHDLARIELAERDRAYLLAELGRAVGLGGRTRLVGGTDERARTSVTRTLRYAIDRIAERLPDLGEHLSSAIRTGAECGYAPDPLSPVIWVVEGGSS